MVYTYYAMALEGLTVQETKESDLIIKYQITVNGQDISIVTLVGNELTDKDYINIDELINSN